MNLKALLLASSLLFTSAASASDAAPASKGKILIVASNPATSPQTGWPVGIWAAELTHPYLAFTEAGYEVEIASPDGGKLAFDAWSDPEHESGYAAHDLISLGFKHSKRHMALLETSRRLADVRVDDFKAVFVAGGQAPMVTFRGNKAVQDAVVAFHQAKKPTALVCHGTTVLLEAKLPNGKLLVEGRTWTGFANSEEDIADKAVGKKVQPYRIEDEARKLKGTTFVVKAPFAPHAIADGHLVTGQQQNSGAEAARLVLGLLATSR